MLSKKSCFQIFFSITLSLLVMLSFIYFILLLNFGSITVVPKKTMKSKISKSNVVLRDEKIALLTDELWRVHQINSQLHDKLTVLSIASDRGNQIDESWENENESGKMNLIPTWDLLIGGEKDLLDTDDNHKHDHEQLTRMPVNLNSELRCYRGEGYVRQGEEDTYQMCTCKNCCFYQDKVYVFENSTLLASSTWNSGSNVTTIYPGVGTARQSIEIIHLDMNNDIVMDEWRDTNVLHLNKPIHLITHFSERTIHPLFIQYVMSNVLQEWIVQKWIGLSFHWVLLHSTSSFHAMDDWLTSLHPQKQQILRTRFNRKNSDFHEKALIDGNYNQRVCFSNGILGYRKHADVWIGHGSNRKENRLDVSKDFIIPLGKNPPIELWQRFVTYIQVMRGTQQNTALHPRKAVFLSRQDSTRRRVINRKKVIKTLETSGFTVEELIVSRHSSLLEVHSILRSASLIIGPHGAGFAHITAANPAAVIVEIHARHCQRIVYGKLSALLNLKYHMVLVDDKDLQHTPASLKKGKSSFDYYRHQDMKVDVQYLKTQLFPEIIDYLQEKSLW